MEIYAVTILPPLVMELRASHPDIRIELDTTDLVRELGAGEADIALRAGYPPEGSGLVGRRLGRDPWTLYCSRAYAAAHPRPRTAAELSRHPIIGGGGDHVWPLYRKWLERQGLSDAVVMEHGSTSGLLSAVRAGMGLAVLPSFMADRDPELVQVIPPPERDRMELWLLTHERLRHLPRVRAVMDLLGERLSQHGKAPAIAAQAEWARAPEEVGAVG